MKPGMNIDEVKFDDVEENGPYTSSPRPDQRSYWSKKAGLQFDSSAAGKGPCRYRYVAQS